jgi:VWFA-related protein
VTLTRSYRAWCIASLVGLALAIPSWAQKTPPHPPFTLHAHIREVLIDITVTDANGNPVTGLPKSAFHIYDNGRPQTIDSFVEHAGKNLAVTPSSTASGAFSNSYLSHPPAVYNVALIDVTTMTLAEQMMLRKQLVHFFEQLPSTEPLAIYLYNGSHIVLVQNFTTSHAQLLAALRRTIPRFRTTGFEYDTDRPLFTQMAHYLSQYPGRKNLLWFNGGSNLFLLFDQQQLFEIFGWQAAADSMPLESYNMRPLYDALDAERIAIYPIDVRGLVADKDYALDNQELMMNDEAATTGGKAYYNTNAIAQSARQILDHSADFYTITYSPHDLHQRGRWHQVRVHVDGPYQLSYRHGYFDDNYLARHPTRLLTVADGEDVQAPSLHSNPILFQAQILHATTSAQRTVRHGAMPYIVRYELPVAAFPIAHLDAQHSIVTFGVATVVLDNGGLVRWQHVKMVEMRFRTTAIQAHPRAHFTWQQMVDLPDGDNDVYLAVWNTHTGRLGTIQIPVNVKRH